MTNVQLKPADLEIDPRQMLQETEVAMAFLLGARQPIPEEAESICGLCRRVIVAEQHLADLETRIDGIAAGIPPRK